MLKFATGLRYRIVIDGMVQGRIQQPDITGALFRHSSQIYPRLGLAELQSRGILGKINLGINFDAAQKQSKITIDLPFNGSRAQASVMIAVIQCLDKISLYPASLELRKIEQTGTDRSNSILKRAHHVYGTSFPLKTSVDPLTKLEQLVSKKPVITLDKFTLGPTFKTTSDVILLEGRNDVLALNEADISNTLGVGGITYDQPKLIQLIKGKCLTLMFDGNAGGKALTEKILQDVGKSVKYVVNLKFEENVEEFCPSVIRQKLKSKTRYNSENCTVN